MSLKLYVLLLIVVLTEANTTTLARNNSDFNYLVSAGYRPSTHTLPKILVSLRRYAFNYYFGDNHFCAGSIYKPNVIITAAHCVIQRITNPEDIYIVAGTINRLKKEPTTQIIDIRKIIPYPRYSKIFLNDDIALLILKNDIKLDNQTTAAVDLVDKQLPPGTKCTALGWGRLFTEGPISAEVVYADLTLWKYKKCLASLKLFSRGMICAKNSSADEISTCQGDSGGPLLCNSKLTGIVSWGYECGSSTPGAYTEIYAYLKWIKENKATVLELNSKQFFLCIIVFLLTMG